MREYNKLVRDKIPEIISNNGENPKYDLYFHATFSRAIPEDCTLTITATYYVYNSETGEPYSQTYNVGDSYVINGNTYSGEYMIQQYWSSNYASNAYNFIQNVNWLKLRSLSLSYDFSNLIKGQNILKNLTATFAANNLFTITNYKGGVPTQRTYSFGLSLTF